MPIYEYDCADCRRRVSVLVRSITSPGVPACPRCGGTSLTRVMSRFFSPRSEDERLESLASSSDFGDLDENDPASVARMMKKMGRELGDDLGDDFGAAMDEAMAEGEGGGDGDGGAETESVGDAGASDDL